MNYVYIMSNKANTVIYIAFYKNNPAKTSFGRVY